MKKITIYDMASCAIMAAVLCLLCPFSIPIGPIPISLATLVIYLAAFVLGWKKATISVAVYLLLGMVGLPVFSGGAGGLAKLAGPTGGYLVGYLFLAIISGLFVEHFNRRWIPVILGEILATAVLYLFGTVWFMIMMQVDLLTALASCVIPFLIGDAIKIVVSIALGKAIYHGLNKAGLLTA